jgi:hypothetical protein
MAISDEEKWKYKLYYLRIAVRAVFSAPPFVFFCILLKRFYSSVIVAPGKPDFWWRTRATDVGKMAQTAGDCANSVSASALSQEFWFTALYLICLTVLVIVSLVYLQRSISRE